MTVDISYEDFDNSDIKKTVIEFRRDSFSSGDIEQFKTLCCELCMSYGFIGNWFYGNSFDEFLKNMNSKDNYVVILNFRQKIQYGIYINKLRKYDE